VRRRDQSHVRTNGFVAPDSLERLILHQPQDFRLQRHRHIPDFVEKDRPSVTLLELADPAAVRAREGAFLVPEQFTLQQVLGPAQNSLELRL
jgi:hypothetical protein